MVLKSHNQKRISFRLSDRGLVYSINVPVVGKVFFSKIYLEMITYSYQTDTCSADLEDAFREPVNPNFLNNGKPNEIQSWETLDHVFSHIRKLSPYRIQQDVFSHGCCSISKPTPTWLFGLKFLSLLLFDLVLPRQRNTFKLHNFSTLSNIEVNKKKSYEPWRCF